MKINILPANIDDSWDFADLHKKCYSAESHFTACFSRELLSDYYRLFLDGKYTVIKAKVSESERGNGFIVAGLGLPEKIIFFKKTYKIKILQTTLSHPCAFLKKIIEVLFYRYRNSSVNFKPCPFLILSIVSDRTAPGIGFSLLEETQKFCKQAGNKKIGLYVRVDNLRALNFYLRNNFIIKGYTTGQFYMEAEL